MSYDSKLAAAREIIAQHNEKVAEKFKVDADAFAERLMSMGVVDEETLALAKWEDLENAGLPKFLAQKVAKAFRSGSGDDDKPKYLKRDEVEALPPDELVRLFDPNEPDNVVGERLGALTQGKRFLVFNRDNTLNVDASVKLLREIREGYPPRETYELDGAPVRVYRVGDSPSRYGDVNPLFPAELLRPDGTCSNTNLSWASVPLKVRQLVYLARERTRELAINSNKDARDIVTMAKLDNAESEIRSIAPKASILFDELEGTGSLPTLRVPLNARVAASERKSNPFGNRTY